MKYNFDPKARSSAIMEDCIAADLGIFNDKSFVDEKSAENTVRNTFEKLGVRFSKTNDGLQIGDSENECIVYVSFMTVLSYDFNKKAESVIEMWNFVNNCLIKYYFNN